jgi:cellulose 1,4-beta-cellobiosidase
LLSRHSSNSGRYSMRTPIFMTMALFFTLPSCAGGIGSVSPSGKTGSSTNPFKDVDFFVNPEYAANVEATAQKYPDEADSIRKVASYPTAVWLSDIKSVGLLPGWLDEAKRQQDRSGVPTLTVVVVYNLPERDCAAESSAGELKADENGEARYRTEFIDPITAQLKAHPHQPIAVVLEPDSLGNLATNMSLPKCQKARPIYRNGIVYALKSFALPNVSVYLDAAHAGWLGWDDNRAAIGKVFRQVLSEAGGPQMIRGFALNVSNYTHLSNRDGAVLEPTNPCPNELTYAKTLRRTLELYGFKDHGFIIDTSRNGKGGIRKHWGEWCNIDGAGLGERPRANPAPGIDAYFWIKPPGESDGSSDPNGPRFDPMCAGRSAAKNAPQAGQWFEAYFLDLVHNAHPAL